MNELRVDPLTGARVVIAPARRGLGGTRPAGLPQPSARCPFCPGHEADLETTVLAVPSSEPWQVRVVKNRFPLFGAEGLPGAHEVVIEHRAHELDLPDYPIEHATLLLDAVQQRLFALERLPGIASVLYFRNRGRRAGSSQPHPHGQITALHEITPNAARQAECARRVAVSEVIRREARVPVASAGPFVAWCPPASERAFQVRIASVEHWPRFSAMPSHALASLAAVLLRVCRIAPEASGSTDYNVLLRDPPVGAEHGGFFFDVFPRTGGDAGFELGSGITVCTVDPEDATRALAALP